MLRRTVMLAAASLLVCQPGWAQSQPYPSKVVKVVVPFAAGGPTDTLARAVSQKLQDAWGQQVIVDNKPGAGGQIGAQVVKQSEPDGHTLFVGATEMFAINQTLFRNFTYNPQTDLKLAAPLLSIPMLLVVPASLEVKSVGELVALSKQRPDGLSYASQGVGSIGHMLGLQFAQKTGAKLVHVPYKGSMPALQDLVGGQPAMMFDVEASSGPFITAGKLRPLAIAAAARSRTLPQVPTLAESGFPGMDASVWMAVAARAGTPPEAIRRINEQVGKALQSPDVTKRFADQGWSPIPMNLDQFNAFVLGETERWGSLIKSSGASVE